MTGKEKSPVTSPLVQQILSYFQVNNCANRQNKLLLWHALLTLPRPSTGNLTCDLRQIIDDKSKSQRPLVFHF